MNVVDKFFLWFFMLPAALYEKAGVDTVQLRAILTAKLTMDNRRPSAFKMQRNQKEKKDASKATLGTMLGALLMGLFMMISFGIGVDLTSKLTYCITIFIFMLCITLITDFTSVLIDVRDNLIILPKPVSDATFVVSRLLHITIRTCMMVIPLSLPSCIAVVVVGGIALFLPFLLMILMSTLFSIFLINAVYIFILKITTPAKFQSIISYIQIVFTVIIFAGYQLMPRLMNESVLSKMSIKEFSYIGFYPPYWFADGCNSLSTMNFNGSGLTSLLLAIFVPLVSIWVVVRYFAPSFNRKLSMITARTEEQQTVKITSGKKRSFFTPERLATLFTESGTEFMGFLFGWKMMGRSRDFKMKVYPSFGSLLVIAVVFLYRSPFKNGASMLAANNLLPVAFILIYMSSLILITALSNMPYTDKFKASWIFYSAPVQTPGLVISGAVKSAVIAFYLPIAFVLLVLGLVFMGPDILLNAMLGFVNVLAIGSIIVYINVRKLPFSSTVEGMANGGGFFKAMIPLFGMAIFGMSHWYISSYTWVVVLLIPLSMLLVWTMFREIKKLSWQNIS